ncbi:MAG TPA: FtsH protease activity modulator HflK [Deltaproteobacteria bacterium]|jgi:membrane protease subunit HflK|nr:FtsH protease activity modulator HflK [Deltaproteobacteria bacterium]
MARAPDPVPSDEKVRRSVRRTLANLVVFTLSLAVLIAWSYFGVYELQPGQAAVVLRLGRYSETVSEPGLRWHLPPPIETHEIVNVASIEREEFGMPAPGEAEPKGKALLEAQMQTGDNNIVNVSFVVRYMVKDAFQSRYRVAEPRQTLRDAAQAAVREVVGRTPIDAVLSQKREQIKAESGQILQHTLDGYESGLLVKGIEIQDAKAPSTVVAAFNEVLAAAQDRSRLVNEAQGYANEVLPKARAQAVEQREQARGYRESKVAEATGAAERFRALDAEYRKAPEVTRRRLYLETMETVLPQVETVVVDPGSAHVLPYLPIGAAKPGAQASPENKK